MSSDDAAMTAILDALIPGDARWPRFSAAVEVMVFVAGLDEIQRARLSAIEGDDAPAALAAWERTEPETFALLQKAAHRAYYTAPSVLAVVRRLAEASPREPQDQFDPTLVARVVATAAGQRRL